MRNQSWLSLSRPECSGSDSFWDSGKLETISTQGLNNKIFEEPFIGKTSLA